MPMNPIDEGWVTRIYTIWANEGGSARAIAQKIRAEGGEVSERTVGRYLKMWPDKAKDERNRYREFHWPESCSSGALPWEAAPAALEMLSHFAERGKRPLLGSVEWFWRVTQVAAGAPYKERKWAANTLAAIEVADSTELNKELVVEVERWLVEYLNSQSQLSEADEVLMALPQMPVTVLEDRAQMPVGATVEARIAVLEARLGHALSPKARKAAEDYWNEINRIQGEAQNDD